jgi:mannose-6-phosphate isomerase-like protein (cupin superfamily)
MAKASRETAARAKTTDAFEGRETELDGYTVAFESYSEDADFGPLFRGLPDDRCQCPHWGVVMKGRLIYTYGDHEEVIEAGEAYFARPGHISKVVAGTEVIEFSPTDELAKTRAAIARNVGEPPAS